MDEDLSFTSLCDAYNDGAMEADIFRDNLVKLLNRSEGSELAEVCDEITGYHNDSAE